MGSSTKPPWLPLGPKGSQFDAQRGRLFSLKHQKSTGVPQIQDLEAAKQASADQILMNEQQIQYLQQQLDGCRQDLAQMQVTCFF